LCKIGSQLPLKGAQPPSFRFTSVVAFETAGWMKIPLGTEVDLSATSFESVCDQDSVMEFGLAQLRTGLRPGSSRFELSRHVTIARTCSTSNLVGDRFEAKFCYAILVTDRFKACRRQVRSQIPLRCLGHRQVRSWSQTC